MREGVYRDALRFLRKRISDDEIVLVKGRKNTIAVVVPGALG